MCLKFVNSKIFCLHSLAVKRSSENTLKWMGTQNKYKRNLQKKTDIVSSEFNKHRITRRKGYDTESEECFKASWIFLELSKTFWAWLQSLASIDTKPMENRVDVIPLPLPYYIISELYQTVSTVTFWSTLSPLLYVIDFCFFWIFEIQMIDRDVEIWIVHGSCSHCPHNHHDHHHNHHDDQQAWNAICFEMKGIIAFGSTAINMNSSSVKLSKVIIKLSTAITICDKTIQNYQKSS